MTKLIDHQSTDLIHGKASAENGGAHEELFYFHLAGVKAVWLVMLTKDQTRGQRLSMSV